MGILIETGPYKKPTPSLPPYRRKTIKLVKNAIQLYETGRPSREVINTQPTVQEMTGQVVASGTPIPLAYGHVQLGAMIGPVIEDGDDYVVAAYFCAGECSSIDTILGNNEPLPAGSTITKYTGTTTQTTDSTLNSLISGYADGGLVATTPGGEVGIVYAVVRYPKSAGFLNLTAEIYGKKVDDPRENLLKWSEKYDESDWTKARTQVTEQAAGTAPNSLDAAWKLYDDTTNNTHVMYQLIANSDWTIGDALYVSCYVKAAEYDECVLLIRNAVDGNLGVVSADLTAGTFVVNTGVGGMESVGDGWYLLWTTGTPTTQSNQTYPALYLNAVAYHLGDGVSGIYTWGWVVARDALRPYSRTTSATVQAQTNVYSNNAGLVLADFWSDPATGRGRAVNTNSVIELAQRCDEQISDGAGGYVNRREVNIAFTRPQAADAISEQLRFYAGCFVDTTGDEVVFVPDAPVLQADHTFTDNHIAISSASAQVIDTSNMPTVVRIWYTDPREVPWRSVPVEAMATGVDTGDTQYRLTEIRAPGIHSAAQAKREAIERLNASTLINLSMQCVLMDEALGVIKGDTADITSAIGLTAKRFRVIDKQAIAIGRYELMLAEYQPNVYSDDTESDPSLPDTSLSDPFNPSSVTGVTLSEEIYTKKDGVRSSRIRISWTAPAYAYISHYEARATVGGEVVWFGSTRDTEIPTSSVEEGILHTCEVRVISTFGGESAWASNAITPQGSLIQPPDVTGLIVYEIAGQVRASWNQVVDIGIIRYAIRWGETTDAWADLENFDIPDVLRWQTNDIPPGTWRIWVAALDTAGLYSTNPVYQDVVVTSDARSYFVGDYDFRAAEASWTLSNVFKFQHGDGRTCYFSYLSTDTLSGIFPNATSTYTDPWASYHGSVSATLTTTAKDYGASYTGTWRATCGATEAKSGTISIELGLSTDDVSYTWGALTRNATARYAKIRISTTTTNTMVLEDDADINIRLDVISHEEKGKTTSGSGGKATVTLDNEYDGVTSIVLNTAYDNTGEATAQVDNIDIVSSPNTFDIYVHVNGTLTSGVDVYWQFSGAISV